MRSPHPKPKQQEKNGVPFNIKQHDPNQNGLEQIESHTKELPQ